MKNGESLIAERFFSKDQTIVDVLFDHYFDNKKADEKYIENAYKEFCHSLLDVDAFQIDKIMSAATVLCMEHERAGFEAGIKTRIQIEDEFTK